MIVLIVAYPLLVHWAVTGQQGVAIWAALTAPVVILLWPSLHRRPLPAGTAAAAAALAAVWVARMDVAVYLLFLPSVLIPLMLLILFSRGLAKPGRPMVTRIAAAIDGELPPEVVRYTRRVTYLWMGVFALMTLTDLSLALLASHELWSLFANGINYVVVAFVFLAEYLVRRRRFPHRRHLAFPDYIRRVAGIDYRRLAG